MTDTEQEILREKQQSDFGERRPFDSSRQATYEDTIGTRRERERDWDHEDRD